MSIAYESSIVNEALFGARPSTHRATLVAVPSGAHADELDLVLLQQAEDALKHLAELTACVDELRQRIWANRLDEPALSDLAADVLTESAHVASFALAVQR
jgi:hypothetical protein